MSLRTRLAVIFSIFYVFGFVLICILKWECFKALELNELGDFLAGAFGPLALAWLVFGYFQQGDELKQGTEALRLQAVELNNSVVQQTKMALANEVSLRNHENSLEPLFKITDSGAGWEDGEFYYSFGLHNLGEYCEDIRVVADIGGREYPARSIGAMFSGDCIYLRRSGMDEWEDFVLCVSYRSRCGRLGKQKFSIISYQPQDELNLEYRAEKHPFIREAVV